MTDDRIIHEIESNPVTATTLTHEVAGWTMTMRRRLAEPPERIWPMLTEPDRLRRWSPIVADRILDVPGPATAREHPDSEPVTIDVLGVKSPRELVHRWEDDVLRWLLEPDGESARLTLEQVFDDPSVAPSSAGGWHICLSTLGAVVVHDDVERVVGPDASAYGFEQLRDAYAEQWRDVEIRS